MVEGRAREGGGHRRALSRELTRLASPLIIAGLLAIAAVVMIAARPGSIRAADPSAGPVIGAARTCAERFPAQGPGGVDLQLGCMAGEIISAYTGAAQSADPERLSTWIARLGVFALLLVALMLLGRTLGRRLGRRLAPSAPDSWWSCPHCMSLNEDHARACYGCGQAWTRDALVLATTTSKPQPADGPPGGGGDGDRDE
jgi:hypothetical protein